MFKSAGEVLILLGAGNARDIKCHQTSIFVHAREIMYSCVLARYCPFAEAMVEGVWDIRESPLPQ